MNTKAMLTLVALSFTRVTYNRMTAVVMAQSVIALKYVSYIKTGKNIWQR